MNATLAGWLDYDLAQFGTGGLTLGDVVPNNAGVLVVTQPGEPGSVRTEIFDVDLRRRNGTIMPVRLFHKIAFAADGHSGPSRTLVIYRGPGGDVSEGLRAAEVRFARFFNNSPLAIATRRRKCPHRPHQCSVPSPVQGLAEERGRRPFAGGDGR